MANAKRHQKKAKALALKRLLIKSKDKLNCIPLRGITTKADLEGLMRQDGLDPAKIIKNWSEIAQDADLGGYFLIQETTFGFVRTFLKKGV